MIEEDFSPYEIKPTGKAAYEGGDLGVYLGDKLIKSFNTISDGGAVTNAQSYARYLKREYLKSKGQNA